MEGDGALSSRAARNFVIGGGAALVVLGVSLWPVTREAPEYAVAPAPAQTVDLQPVPGRMTQPVVPLAAPAQQNIVPAPAPVRETESDERHPHPITLEHEALQQELRLVGALQDALDLHDVPALRALVERYRAHVPGDENKLGEGYARLADCLDDRVLDQAAARAAAASYYQNERASTLRRYIRRYCLEH